MAGNPSTQRQVSIEPTAEQATDMAAQLIKTMVCESVSNGGYCRLALAGGTTPYLLYQQLARTSATGEVPWESTEIFFSDERDVPQHHVESNYNMARRTLLDNVPIEPARVHPMPGDSPDLAAAADQYEQTIRKLVPAGPSGLPQFDIILLGMGADGHTASLFPCVPDSWNSDRLVITHFVPALGRSRMTFTFKLINAAARVVMLVTGSDKAPAIHALLTGDDAARAQLPASRVQPNPGKLFLVLDAAAAKLIQT
jgi:6-phosphogluconolactonase